MKNHHSTRLAPFEYQIFRENQGSFVPIKNRRVLLMVSGGADSVAMFRVLCRLKKRLKITLEVLHVHHGPSAGDSAYRDAAVKFVAQICAEEAVPFHLVKSSQKLSSEAEFRELRLNAMERLWNQAVAKEDPFFCIALAHHQNDLLETRLIRLLRGTGLSGLRAMRCWGKVRQMTIWRPFLSCWSKDLRDYLNQTASEWLEDPSNQSDQYLRNSVRNQLLPQIEAVRQGSLRSLARSLEIIAREGVKWQERFSNIIDGDALKRREFRALQIEKQEMLLSEWLQSRGVRNYSARQIKEVIKRLDTDQRRLNFTLCGRNWRVDEKINIAAQGKQTSSRDSNPAKEPGEV